MIFNFVISLFFIYSLLIYIFFCGGGGEGGGEDVEKVYRDIEI